MKPERLTELAALQAAGALTPAEMEEFSRAMAQAGAAAHGDQAKFNNLAALIASAFATPQAPPAAVKEKLLARLDQHVRDKESGFRMLRLDDNAGWMDLPIPGASVKILTIDRTQGYAVLLGKLAPGARYPAHRHFGSEDVYMLTGDLHMGDHVLHAGDFHHADAGTVHGVNYSEHGCTLLAVVSVADLQAQADPNSDKWVKS